MIPFTTLLTQPKHAWGDLSASVDRHPRGFVPLWLALPLVPAICLFIGTTQVGWRLPGNDQTQYLSASSGALLALWCYLGFLCGVVIMAYLVRWVLFRTESRPDIGRSMAFTTTIAVPLMLAGVVALVPSRWLMLLAAALATACSAFLLFSGLPVFMHLRQRKAVFYAGCILGFGFLALLTTAFAFLELWGQSMAGSGEYLEQ